MVGRRGANLKVPLLNLGEGFRVRAGIHAGGLLNVQAIAEGHCSMITTLLHDRKTLLAEIHGGVRLNSKIFALMVSSLCCFAVYGAIIGAFHSALQSISSAIKLPALYLLTLMVCLPTLYVFNVLFGSKQSIAQHLAYLLTAISFIALLLCGFAPVTLFFLVTVKDYAFFVILNVVIFALTGILGVSFFYQVMKPKPEEEIEPKPKPPSPAKKITDFIDPEVQSAWENQVRQNLQVRTNILRFWLGLYGIVGSQLSWTLSPFFGEPDKRFQFLNQTGGSFFVELWRIWLDFMT